MRIWRISGYANLSGKGGTVAAARWNPLNTRIVYCADHPASCLLEMLVHVDAEDAPKSYQLLGVDVPDEVKFESPDVPDWWRDDIAFTQNLGRKFVRAGRFPIMRVPSVIVPFAWNYLLNPDLVEQAGIAIASITNHPIDQRLIG